MEEPVKGLSGWLSPEGVFYPCGYMTHGQVARQIIDESLERAQNRVRLGIDQGTVLSHDTALRMMDWIVMGCDPDRPSQMDYIFFPTHDIEWRCTEEQQKWLEEHKDQMRPKQLKHYTQEIAWYEEKAK